jgi:hypothetical protein
MEKAVLLAELRSNSQNCKGIFYFCWISFSRLICNSIELENSFRLPIVIALPINCSLLCIEYAAYNGVLNFNLNLEKKSVYFEMNVGN